MELNQIIDAIGVEPYYREDAGVIYNADCLDILPKMPEKCVDLVVTDPPYNVGFDYGENTDDNRDDFIEWIKPRFREIDRIAETILISTGQLRLPDYAFIKKWKWIIDWHKPAAMGRSPVGFCNHEPVAMWGKGSNAGVDVITAPIVPDAGLDGHPCPKPLNWAIKLIALFPNSKIVLDPFLGSGTTAVAAKQLGRKYIGIEIEKKYCDIAVQRLAQEILI